MVTPAPLVIHIPSNCILVLNGDTVHAGTPAQRDECISTRLNKYLYAPHIKIPRKIKIPRRIKIRIPRKKSA